MFQIALDIRTLSFITVLFAFGFGAGLITFSVVHSAYSDLKQVGIGLACIGLGCFLIGFRDTVSAAISIVTANMFVALGFMFINSGIRKFRRLPRPEAWSGVPFVVLMVLSLSYFTYVHPSFPYRVFGFGVCIFGLSALCCRSVLQGSHGVIVSQKVLAVGFGLFCLFMLVRSWLVLDENTMQQFMKAGAIHGMAFLAVILIMVNTTFGLIWMANDLLVQELQQYEKIISTTPEGIALVDKEGRYRLVNDSILKFMHLSKQEMLGKRSLDLFGKNFYEALTLPNVQRAFAGETGATSTWLELPGGEKIYVTITYYPVPDAKGNESFAAIHIRNMTELYYAQKEKQRIFELSLDMFCILGMDGAFTEVNPAWTRVLGWSEEELVHTPWSEFAHPDDMEISHDAWKRLLDGKPVIDFVSRVRTKQGTYKHISWMTYPDLDAKRFYSVGRDVTDRIRMEEELRELATNDPLTGANNRRVLMQRLNIDFARSSRYDTPLCLLMLDIDHFKNVNDTHGHAVGDKVLQQCVKICKQTLRSSDAFGRIGGEEFAAVLPHTDLKFGLETAERLRKNLSGFVLKIETVSLRFTVSVGVAELRTGESMEDLLKRADDALYRAKQGGRNRVEGG